MAIMPTSAQAVAVDLELALLVDVSGSVNSTPVPPLAPTAEAKESCRPN